MTTTLHQVNSQLTKQNAPSLGFTWDEDVLKFESLSKHEQEILTHRIQEWDLALGKPAFENSETHVGVYSPILPDIEVDSTLTPENASEKGYEWTSDIFYDPDAPAIAMQSTLDAVLKEHFKLGMPASSNEDLYGLYAPIEKTNS